MVYCYDNGSGRGPEPAGFDLSSGRGTNVSLSFGGKIILPCFQSSFACSILSLREDTKFHQINLSPNGSPPNNISVLFFFALSNGSSFLENTIICPSW